MIESQQTQNMAGQDPQTNKQTNRQKRPANIVDVGMIRYGYKIALFIYEKDKIGQI